MNNDETNVESDFLELFRSRKNGQVTKSEPKNNSDLAPPPYADEYKMDHAKRGVAVILNHVNFSLPECPIRNGSNVDRDDLIKIFHELNFDVVVHNDLTAHEVNSVLMTVSQMDHTNSDCLLIVVMSHGDKGRLYARDKDYSTKLLWAHFNARNCPTLAGKPKLFFIQACRGQGFHQHHILRYSTRVEEDSNSTEDAYYSIPVMADILVMYSTIEGFYSWRDPEKGSYFIQSLAKQLRSYYQSRDLLTILTFVNREVAVDFTSFDPKIPEYCGRKQMCSIVSMLTRLLYFSKTVE